MSKNNLPFNVMRNRNSWDNVPRNPYAVGNFIIGTILGTGTQYLAVIYATGFAATTLVVSAISRALMPRPPSMQEGLLTNFRQPAAPWDVVYGQTRKGGTITYMESTGDENKYLHMIVTLAGHEVEELGDVYINDSVVTIDGDNYVTSDPWVKSGDSEFVYIRKFTGASNQDVYSTLSAIDDGPTFLNEGETNTASNFKGQGVACLYIRMKYDREVFASGIPSVTCVVKGKKVYDPRTDATAYSDNAALCIRDYLVNEYGLNTPESTIDDTYFSTAANDCDNSSGSGEDNKFRMNGRIQTDRNLKANLQDMVGACVGNLYYSAGKFKLIAGVYSAPVKDLTLDDLRSEISLETKSSRRDNFNSVQGTFIWSGVDDGTGNNGDWTQTDYPPITSPTFVTEDNEYENPLQLDLPLTTNSATAQRIAKQTLFRAREQMFVTAEFGMKAFDLEVGDTVTLTVDRYGFDAKEFEVISWAFAANQDAGDLRVTLGLKETSSAAYAWDGEEEDITSNNSNLPDFRFAPQPTFSGTPSTQVIIQEDGTVVSNAQVSWDVTDESSVYDYILEWRLEDDVAGYQSIFTSNKYYLVPSLEIGEIYDFRISSRNVLGIQSATSEVSYRIIGDITPPALPVLVSVTGGYQQIIVDWDNPTDRDFDKVEVYSNTINSLTGVTKIGETKGSFFTDSTVGDDETRYYFLKSVDHTGNDSAFTEGVDNSATTRAAIGDGASVVPVYADDASGTNKSYTAGTRTFVLYYEYVDDKPPIGDITGTFVKFVGEDGPEGPQGDTGATGDTGARYATVRYYAESSSTPSTSGLPSGVSYTWATATATASYGVWSTTAPTVDAAGSNDYWYIDITFVDPTGEASFSYGSTNTSPVALFNFNGLVTFTNTSGTTDLNTALSDASTIIDGGRITTGSIDADLITVGTLTADRINLTGSQLESSSGALVVAGGGIGTLQIAQDAVSGQDRFYTAPSGCFASSSGTFGATIFSTTISANSGDKFYISTETSNFNLSNWTLGQFMNLYTFLNGASFSSRVLIYPTQTSFHEGCHYGGIFVATATGNLTLDVRFRTNNTTANSAQCNGLRVNVLKLER